MKSKYVMVFTMIISATIVFNACDNSSGGGNTDDPASSMFVSKSILPAGEKCPTGGVQINMGFDNNHNDILDTDEITNTEYICNGADGADGADSVNSLGNITTDTTWKTGNTYIIDHNIVVKEGVKLTVEPGAIISFNPDSSLIIDGTLNAQGTSSQHIIFKNESNYFRNADIKCFFTVTSINNILKNIEFQETPIVIDGGNFIIEYCKYIEPESVYNEDSGSFIHIKGLIPVEISMSNCTITGTPSADSYPAAIEARKNSTITINNCIFNKFYWGLFIRGSSTITVSKCSIIDNYFGIECTDNSTSTVNNSNLINTYQNYKNGSTVSQDATSNWWGTTDTSKIDSLIYDYLDEVSNGTVDYSSYLNSEVSVTGCGW